MTSLSTFEIDELEALRESNRALGGPSFIMRRHWHESGYRRLVQKGLVRWGEPPRNMNRRRFAGTEITIFGCLVLDAALEARAASGIEGEAGDAQRLHPEGESPARSEAKGDAQ